MLLDRNAPGDCDRARTLLREAIEMYRTVDMRKHLEIAYTGLSFTSPTQTRFRVQLEGFDPEWRDFGTRRVAYYDGLSPGALGCAATR